MPGAIDERALNSLDQFLPAQPLIAGVGSASSTGRQDGSSGGSSRINVGDVPGCSGLSPEAAAENLVLAYSSALSVGFRLEGVDRRRLVEGQVRWRWAVFTEALCKPAQQDVVVALPVHCCVETCRQKYPDQSCQSHSGNSAQASTFSLLTNLRLLLAIQHQALLALLVGIICGGLLHAVPEAATAWEQQQPQHPQQPPATASDEGAEADDSCPCCQADPEGWLFTWAQRVSSKAAAAAVASFVVPSTDSGSDGRHGGAEASGSTAGDAATAAFPTNHDRTAGAEGARNHDGGSGREGSGNYDRGSGRGGAGKVSPSTQLRGPEAVGSSAPPLLSLSQLVALVSSLLGLQGQQPGGGVRQDGSMEREGQPGVLSQAPLQEAGAGAVAGDEAQRLCALLQQLEAAAATPATPATTATAQEQHQQHQQPSAGISFTVRLAPDESGPTPSSPKSWGLQSGQCLNGSMPLLSAPGQVPTSFHLAPAHLQGSSLQALLLCLVAALKASTGQPLWAPSPQGLLTSSAPRLSATSQLTAHEEGSSDTIAKQGRQLGPSAGDAAAAVAGLACFPGDSPGGPSTAAEQAVHQGSDEASPSQAPSPERDSSPRPASPQPQALGLNPDAPTSSTGRTLAPSRSMPAPRRTSRPVSSRGPELPRDGDTSWVVRQRDGASERGLQLRSCAMKVQRPKQEARARPVSRCKPSL